MSLRAIIMSILRQYGLYKGERRLNIPATLGNTLIAVYRVSIPNLYFKYLIVDL